MKILPLELRKNSFDYIQIKRNRYVAMYEQTTQGKHIAYEVFLIRIAKESEAFGKTYEEHEAFPGNEDFGKWAWSFMTLENAEKEYQNISRFREKHGANIDPIGNKG